VSLLWRIVVGLLFWSLALPIALVGLAARGLYEALVFGWTMPEQVKERYAQAKVEDIIRGMKEYKG
jgi:hypothetical protein